MQIKLANYAIEDFLQNFKSNHTLSKEIKYGTATVTLIPKQNSFKQPKRKFRILFGITPSTSPIQKQREGREFNKTATPTDSCKLRREGKRKKGIKKAYRNYGRVGVIQLFTYKKNPKLITIF